MDLLHSILVQRKRGLRGVIRAEYQSEVLRVEVTGRYGISADRVSGISQFKGYIGIGLQTGQVSASCPASATGAEPHYPSHPQA